MRSTTHSILAVISVCVSLAIWAPALSDQHDAQKAVLVTGASTGIGREIAETLAENGFFVYAGARKQKDLDALNAIDNIKSVRLDVTQQDEIDAAVETVRAGGKGLYGLVNNAGVYIGGPLIDVDIEEVKWLMDVNVFGVYRVTQAFAPMIIESKGRITTIGSISGTLSGRFSGPYSMSKHAIEAFTDSLATEMQKFDVHVSVIEPGNYNSEISNTALQRMREKDYAQPGAFFRRRTAGVDEPAVGPQPAQRSGRSRDSGSARAFQRKATAPLHGRTERERSRLDDRQGIAGGRRTQSVAGVLLQSRATHREARRCAKSTRRVGA